MKMGLNMLKMSREKSRAGFSLVEITLALLVIAVGVLAVFGLIGDALRANTNTLDDTMAATFAESVFSSIFAADWDVLDNGKVPILMGQGFWNQEGDDEWIELPTDEPKSLKFHYKPKDSDAAIDYYPLQYDLTIEKQKTPDGSVDNSENYDSDAVWRALRLKVWIGEFADTSDEDAYQFYTEQYKFVNPSKEYENRNQNSPDD